MTYFHNDPNFVSPEDQDRIMAKLGPGTLDDLIAEGAAYEEAAKPQTKKDAYLANARAAEAHGIQRARLAIALAVLKARALQAGEREVMYAIIALMQKGLSLAVSDEMIAAEIKCAVKSVQVFLHSLEKQGFIRRQRMAFNGDGRAVAHVTLNPEMLTRAHDEIAAFTSRVGSLQSITSTAHKTAGTNDQTTRRETASDINPNPYAGVGVRSKLTPMPAVGSAFPAENANPYAGVGGRPENGHLTPMPVQGLAASPIEAGHTRAATSTKLSLAVETVLSAVNGVADGTTPAKSKSTEVVPAGSRPPAAPLPVRTGELLPPESAGRGDDPLDVTRWDEARQRLLVRYPDGKPFAITWRTIEAAASAAGFPIQHLKGHVEAIAAGWATPADWRKSKDGTYRPTNVLAELTADLAKAKSRMMKALAEGKRVEAEAAAALPGPGGAPRRFTDRLEQAVPNAAFIPMTRGTANTILDAADALRKGEGLATPADFQDVLNAVRKGDQPSQAELAKRIATKVARSFAQPDERWGWLKDEAGIADELAQRWPHVPREIIDQQVNAVSRDPRLAGINPLDWTAGTEAEVREVLLSRFGVVVNNIRAKKWDPLTRDFEFWLSGPGGGRPTCLVPIGRAFVLDHEEDQFWEGVRRQLNGLEGKLIEALCVRDLREVFQEAMAQAVAAVLGRPVAELPEFGMPLQAFPFKPHSLAKPAQR